MTYQSNILDPVRSQLPDIWENPGSDRPVLKPRYAHFIKKHIYNALEKHGYEDPQAWSRLYVTGSLTTYQYSSSSDVDVNVYINSDKLPEWSRAEMIGIMVSEVDGTVLPGTPYALQAYIMPRGSKPANKYQSHIRSGYDIDDQRWIEPPDRTRIMDIEKEENAWYVIAVEGADKMESLMKYEPRKAVMYFHQIHKRRQRDAEKGDFGPANVIYKMLDKRGLLDRLHELELRFNKTSSWQIVSMPVIPPRLDALGQTRHQFTGEPGDTWGDEVWKAETQGYTHEDWERQRQLENEWDRAARYAMATGRMTPEQVTSLGYRPSGHEADGDWNAPAWGRWQPLPEDLYHVTTNLPAIRASGVLRSPDELDLEGKGRGLGGGTQDTISFTNDPEAAENIRNTLTEGADVASGRKPIQQLVDEARTGFGAKRPWLKRMFGDHDWSKGNPRELDDLLLGRERFNKFNLPEAHPLKHDRGLLGLDLRTPEEWQQFGYAPYEDETPMPSVNQAPLYNGGQVYRHLSPQEHTKKVFDWWRVPYLMHRQGAGGPENPVITGVDPDWFANIDPSHIGVVHARPVSNAHGYPMGSLSEWRVPTGDAVNITDINGEPYVR